MMTTPRRFLRARLERDRSGDSTRLNAGRPVLVQRLVQSLKPAVAYASAKFKLDPILRDFRPAVGSRTPHCGQTFDLVLTCALHSRQGLIAIAGPRTDNEQKWILMTL